MLKIANKLKAGDYIPIVVNGVVTMEQIDSVTAFENSVTEDLQIEIVTETGKINTVPITCKINVL